MKCWATIYFKLLARCCEITTFHGEGSITSWCVQFLSCVTNYVLFFVFNVSNLNYSLICFALQFGCALLLLYDGGMLLLSIMVALRTSYSFYASGFATYVASLVNLLWSVLHYGSWMWNLVIHVFSCFSYL